MKENTLKCPGAVGRFLSLTCAVGAGVLLASVARADIKYTQETRMNEEQNAQAPASIMTRTVSPVAERTDIRSYYGKMQVDQSTIRLCEKNQEIQVDDGLKIYTIKSLNEKLPAAGNAQKPENKSKSEKNSGKIITTYHVKDLGEEMVAGFKTRHYLITTGLKFSGCVGNNEMESKVEIWVSDIQDATPCATKFDPATAYAAMAPGDCKMSFEQKGDVDAYTKIYKGIVLRQKIYDGDKVLMTQEVTSLSQAKLDNDPFTIPVGYKQVTPEQFQAQQSAAMMNTMMAGDFSADE